MYFKFFSFGTFTEHAVAGEVLSWADSTISNKEGAHLVDKLILNDGRPFALTFSSGGNIDVVAG